MKLLLNLIFQKSRKLSIPSRIIYDCCRHNEQKHGYRFQFHQGLSFSCKFPQQLRKVKLSIPSRIIPSKTIVVQQNPKLFFQFHQGLSHIITRFSHFLKFSFFSFNSIKDYQRCASFSYISAYRCFQFHQGLSRKSYFSRKFEFENFQFHQGLSYAIIESHFTPQNDFQFHQGLSNYKDYFCKLQCCYLSIPSRIIITGNANTLVSKSSGLSIPSRIINYITPGHSLSQRCLSIPSRIIIGIRRIRITSRTRDFQFHQGLSNFVGKSEPSREPKPFQFHQGLSP